MYIPHLLPAPHLLPPLLLPPTSPTSSQRLPPLPRSSPLHAPRPHFLPPPPTSTQLLPPPPTSPTSSQHLSHLPRFSHLLHTSSPLLPASQCLVTPLVSSFYSSHLNVKNDKKSLHHGTLVIMIEVLLLAYLTYMSTSLIAILHLTKYTCT